jgi:hypothetical protein
MNGDVPGDLGGGAHSRGNYVRSSRQQKHVVIGESHKGKRVWQFHKNLTK